jgi:HEAT repeat protein
MDFKVRIIRPFQRTRTMNKATLLGFAVLGVLSWYPAAAAEQTSAGFDGAQWIWSSSDLRSMGAGVSYFRGGVDIPENPALKSAEIMVTCDNLFVLYVNGQPMGESDTDNNAWQRPKRWDLTGRVAPGRCVLAVEAVNTLPGPAGLLVKFTAELADGEKIVLTSDPTWKSQPRAVANWQQPDFDDQRWTAASVVGQYGDRPWGRVAVPPEATPGGTPVGKVSKSIPDILQQASRHGQVGPVVAQEPDDDFHWPAAVAFVGDDCSLYRTPGREGSAYDSLNVTIFNPRNARVYPEHDLPAPMKVGRKLYKLAPARPGVEPQLLLDAGRGAIGSPSVSFDGRSILVSMVHDDEPFFHIYRVPADGGPPQRLTDGPFHDIDPVELPDGRLVFTSTRIGRFEEYHAPPSRSLHIMNADGSGIRPLTHTIIFDNEPEVLADGRIIFIRSDNFFDRGKVETLLHATRTDGSGGYTEFGLDIGPEYGGRLRAYLCGSPAPMPDGRLAYLSAPGITVGRLGMPAAHLRHYSITAGDVAALPDGRLLCTTAVHVPKEIVQGNQTRTIQDLSYQKIAVLDPDSQPPALTVVYESPSGALHSPVFLGARPRPPQLIEKVDPAQDRDPAATGVLFCQNVRYTQKTTAGWPHVRAIRVLAVSGLTVRSSHSYIVHSGSDVRELGTVPLAPDGSFAIEVPADTPIALQAVDAEGRSELNEMSWIYVRPGEQRGCIGCHHKRQAAPLIDGSMPLALQTDPLRLTGEGQPLRFRGNNAAVTGLMELQFDRFREIAGINRYGEPEDAAETGSDEVAAAVAQLRQSNWRQHVSAAQRLAIFRDQSAAPALAERLTGSRREVRVAAAVALAACGTRQSVPPLLAALDDSDPLVAQAAAMALENLTGHDQPFDAFVPADERKTQSAAWSDWFAKTTWEQIEAELVARVASGGLGTVVHDLTQTPRDRQEAPQFVAVASEPVPFVHDRDLVRRAAVALSHTGSLTASETLRGYLAHHRHNNPYPEWKKTHQVDNTRFNSLSEVNPRTLQAVARAIGELQDAGAVELLAETIAQHNHPNTGNLFLAEACVEALGRIGTPEAEDALVEAFAALDDYPKYTLWYGDHPALMACHASPVHHLIVEALDRLASTRAHKILPDLILSLPVDPDRALLLENDDTERLVGRVIRRHGAEAAVVETCLAMLGDAGAVRDAAYQAAISKTHRCWGGHPGPEIRAAQVLSLVCRNPEYAPRILEAFERFRAKPVDIPRVFDRGIPVVLELPLKHWVCFYLGRALGNLADSGVAASLATVLEQSPPEAADGYPDPLGPGVLFLHNDLTPCWRAAVAWALGEIGDRRAVPVLLAVVGDLRNATDTRHSAAVALGKIADPQSAAALAELAADYPEESTRRALIEAQANAGR